MKILHLNTDTATYVDGDDVGRRLSIETSEGVLTISDRAAGDGVCIYHEKPMVVEPDTANQITIRRR